ncbi:MAG: PEP-CTERM sorting domain-containing protein [Verrucomicrobiales bacterium]|nr:PEP-CTERM sorting domain-containing protein [Verrucomicrobiales bacterium]
MKRISLPIVAALVASQAPGAEVLIDTGFEAGVALSTSPTLSSPTGDPPNTGDYASNLGSRGQGIPTSTGVWTGDPTQVVTDDELGNSWAADNSAFTRTAVVPRTGSNMLQFVGTSSSDALYDATDTAATIQGNSGSDLWQAYSPVGADATGVDEGRANVTLSGWFASGGDNFEFLVEVRFYTKALADPSFSFQGSYGGDQPANYTIADALNTGANGTGAWTELTTGELDVPANTELIIARIGAIQNGRTNGTHGEEFHAAFADDISLDFTLDDAPVDPPVIPEPTRAALLFLGVFAMIARRRRN